MSLIGVPFTPPWSLKYFSAIFAPVTSSCPSRAVLLVCATPMPIGMAPFCSTDPPPEALPVPGVVPIAACVGVTPAAAVGLAAAAPCVVVVFVGPAGAPVGVDSVPHADITTAPANKMPTKLKRMRFSISNLLLYDHPIIREHGTRRAAKYIASPTTREVLLFYHRYVARS